MDNTGALAAIPNLRHLRVLQTVERLHSVSRASEELNISQPAVTQAVAKMETDLGVALFDRGTAGTFPTAIGSQFLGRVTRFFDVLEQALTDTAPPADRTPRRSVERMITTTHIRSLMATVDPATVAEVARQINVSETSLYRSARDLEHILRRVLFTRSSTGPVCNPCGQELARQFRRAVREIDYGREEVALACGAADPLIVIGVLPMSGSVELAAAISAFLKCRPQARIKVVDGTYLWLLEALRDCRIDMIFGMLRRPDWANDVDEEPLFQDSFSIVCRPNHPLTRLVRVTPEDMAGYDWIVPAAGTPRRQQTDDLFQNLAEKPRLAIETSSLPTLRALLAGSDLVTVMTKSEVSFDLANGLLTCLDFPLNATLPPKGVTTRSGWLPTEMHAKFLELLRDHTSRPVHRADPPKHLRVASTR